MPKRFIRVLCLLLVLGVVLSTGACRGNNGESKTLMYSDKVEKSQSTGSELRQTVFQNLSFVVSVGLLHLYFDNKTCGIVLYDANGKQLWNALPEFAAENPAVLQATLISENGRYMLNSQDNSVAFSSYSVNFVDNGLTITYYMSNNETTVNKATDILNPGEMYLIVPVTYALEDTGLKVSVDCADIFVSEGYVLENLALLPYFGSMSYTQKAVDAKTKYNSEMLATLNSESAVNAAQTANENRDFLLVPDGSGGVLYTRLSDENTENISFRVYGDALTEDEKQAAVGAFGIKKDGCAMLGVITDGDELATVTALRSSADSDSINRVYASFNVTQTQVQSNRLYYGKAYDGKITVEYRFLSGKQANAVSMAASCREVLIRAGFLSSKTITESEMPLNIGITGTVNGGYRTAVSDFEEAEDLLGQLKAKGVNQINLILNGFFEDGLLQNNTSDLSPLKKLGGSSDFEHLCEYASKQKLSLFAGIHLLSAGSKSETARSSAGQLLTVEMDNPLYPYFGKEQYQKNLLSVGLLEEEVIHFMINSKNYNITGFCINDVNTGVYADAKTGESLSESVRMISENVSSFSVRSALMLSGAPFYAVKDASYLLDVPFYTQYTETEGYEAVPFVPAVLHGTLWYSGNACNTKTVTKLEMLKCVEYGGLPYFPWLFDKNPHLYYGLTLNDAVDFTVRAADELSDLFGARMTGHTMLQEGVYETQYDNGAVVYVNYNNYSVNIGNIAVYPYDYIRIN